MFFKKPIKLDSSFFLPAAPATLTKPVPSKSIVAGSGAEMGVVPTKAPSAYHSST